MLSHRETQAAFNAALAEDGVPSGVTAVGNVARRFGVYRNTVFHSLTEALGQRFPTVRRIVGARFFDAATGVFIRSNPPRTPLIQNYGSEFPTFLTTFPPASRLPYLRDVAQLELLRGRAYHAADATPLSPEAFALATAATPDRATLALHPSVHMLSSVHPAVSIWEANHSDAPSDRIAPGAEAALLFREGSSVVVLPVAPAILPVLSSIADGTPLGETWAAAPTDDVAATLVLLLRHGLIIGVTLSQS